MGKKLKFWLLFALVLVMILASVGQAASGDNGEKQRYIVSFEPGATVNSVALEGLAHRFGGDVQPLPLANGALVILPPTARGLLEAIPGALVEEDGIVTILGIGDAGDPEVVGAWGVDRIDAEKAWGTTTGAGVKVGIIDTGINYNHPDLAGAYIGGYDYVNKDTNPADDNGHGTHVAGTIAARKNGFGVVGVAPDASLYAYKVLNSSGSGYWSDVIAALGQAVADGVKVVNMSLGANSAPRALQTACDNAYITGVLLVAAAGNDGKGSVLYPAKYNSVIAVAATNSADQRPWWSNFGSQIELAAPGVGVNSTYLGSTYAILSGTSMATPHVTGVVTLILGSGRASTASGVRTILQQTADDLGTAGKDKYYGYGLVDAQEAATGIQTLP